MIKTKKAQLAMETVMIYGLAILIVILAVSALIYFDVLDLGNLLPDRCEIKGVSLNCENYIITKSTNTVTLEIRNNLGRNINIESIKIYGEEGTDMEGMLGTCQFSTSTFVVNGNMQKFVVPGCTIQIPAGKKITGIIELTYKVTGSEISIIKFGEIRASVT